MLVLEWIRADLLALLVIVVIGITRLMPVEQLFDGFAGNAVISLIAVMIMGAGLDRTGVLSKAASLILRARRRHRGARVAAGQRDGRQRSRPIMQSQALATLFVPVVSRVSARTGVPLKRLLLPMACMILCGTNVTMISNSPLILLNDLIASANRNLPPGAQTIRPVHAVLDRADRHSAAAGRPRLLRAVHASKLLPLTRKTARRSRRAAPKPTSPKPTASTAKSSS